MIKNRLAKLLRSLADVVDPNKKKELKPSDVSQTKIELESVNAVQQKPKPNVIKDAVTNVNLDKKAIKQKVDNMRDAIIKAANNPDIPIPQVEREAIKMFIEESALRPRPGDVPGLMVDFMECCFAYSVVKKFLVHHFNNANIPGEYTLPKALAAIYGKDEFLNRENWYPDKLNDIGKQLFDEHLAHLGKFSTNKPFNRIIIGLVDAPVVMSKKLKNGLETFYSELDSLGAIAPSERWRYAEDFSRNIRQVGHNLIFDFLKYLGCKDFVKLDHHVVKMLPEIGLSSAMNKKNFVKMIELAEELGYSPLEFDHIVYQYHHFRKYL